MPFGLCNAPATFERLMDRVLQGLRWSRCLVYLDDIISFGSTFDGALANLTLIFERLRSYGLQLKSTKCHLFRSSVPFLGHIVGRHGLECDPAKIEDVKSWPVPDCLKSVRQFLGFVGYYRRFIPSFADVATPLVTLTGKDVPFVWDSSCSTAFAALRAALIDVRSRMIRNVWSHIVVERCDPHRDAIALLSAKCWLQWPCASSFDPTCVGQDLPFARTTSRWFGYIASKTQKA